MRHLSAIESRHLVPVMTKCYESIKNDGLSLMQLQRLLSLSVQNWNAKDSEKHHEQLFLFILQNFDIRATEQLSENYLIDDLEQLVTKRRFLFYT